ncbi:UvrD-helicase domain-containing protein [Candidatus Palauibacter irciniicola]|uniref:UvrD-helicase domain-containing protein n=1 Tax=Candidatus Palauibacter irciniicola TaxID=3056733 RepID=UPI003B01D7A2
MAEIRWTPEQVRAIRSEDDTLLVANAGTGKTTTVVGKIMWRLGLPFGVSEQTGEPIEPPADPCGLDEIAAITFTEKAAYDLKRQLRKQIEASDRADDLRWEIDRASVGTIHSFCGELLREHALRLGIDPTYEVLDEDSAWAEQDELIKALLLERLEAEDPAAQALLRRWKLTGGERFRGATDHVRDVLRDLRWRERRYSRWLQPELPELPPAEDGTLDLFEAHGRPGALDLPAVLAASPEREEKDEEALAICSDLLDVAREARGRWDAWLEEENRRDFDSLVLGAAELLAGASGQAALAAIRDRYRMLIIDEFQDTDFTQRDIAFAIARGADRPQLFLVGDPKQSIYRFRGADISVWNEVAADFAEEGEVLDLSRNFRSAPPIVDFVNVVSGVSMKETGDGLAEERLPSRIGYTDLVAGIPDHAETGVDWIGVEGRTVGARREAEAVRIASWILESVDRVEIRDPDTGSLRPLAFRDIALLYRSRGGLKHFETTLKRYGIPYFVSGMAHLGERQEILDVLNALRLLQNERDDLRAFGYLRSPFVGLRDETIARLRMLGRRGPLLRQASRWLENGEWPEAPDHPRLTAIEREALEEGLSVLDDLRQLAPRMGLDEVIEELLVRTGYRLHILLMEGAEEVLGNLQSLIHFAASHRAHDLTAFFEVWDRSMNRDIGLPQAPLYSKEDDIVTLSTIHQAKGLEWPVVFLVGVEKALWRQPSNVYWSDPELGPLFCLRADARGKRGNRLVRREELESKAEEARLLYVAATRARDRLVIVGPTGGNKGYDRWLAKGDATTRQHAEVSAAPETRRPPMLEWLDRYETATPPALIHPLPEPPLRWTRSATELMLLEEDPEEWERRYRHGALAPWHFAPETSTEEAGLPALVRGQIIHGVLERLEAEAEIARVVEETIGSLDEPELEAMLRPGSEYREQLEEEIRRVAASEEWAWYTEGELGRDYWKELTFTHLLGARDWRFGAFDLYRRLKGPDTGPAPGTAPARLAGALGLEEGLDALVIDFKTHPITAAQAPHAARGYRIQADVYRAAASSMAGRVAVGLHFTGPNELVPMPEKPQR